MSLPIKKPAFQGTQAFYQYRNRLKVLRYWDI